jgi:hypothetical protein
MSMNGSRLAIRSLIGFTTWVALVVSAQRVHAAFFAVSIQQTGTPAGGGTIIRTDPPETEHPDI